MSAVCRRAASAAYRSRMRVVVGVDDPSATGLGVDDRDQPDVGQFELATVDHLHGDHLVPRGEGAQRPLPRRLAEEVGHDDRHAAALGGLADEADRPGEIAGVAVGRWGTQRGQHRGRVGTARSGGDQSSARARGDGTDAVAAAAGEKGERSRRRPRQLVLGGSAGSERVARRRVEHQPQLELVVGDRVAHVGVVGAGRDGPVDVARVVAGHVRPCFAALGAVTGEQPGMVAGQQPVEAADDGQLQPTRWARKRAR